MDDSEDFIEESFKKICHNFNIARNEFINVENISFTEEIPIISGSDILTESVNTFKSALMLTIEKLNSTIDFLKNELEERNFHIRTLLLRDANDGRSIDIGLLETSQENIPIIETTSSVITDNIFNDEKISSLNQNQLPANENIYNRDIDDDVNRVDATNSHNSSIVSMESAASNVSSVLDSTRFFESSNSSTDDESNYSSIVTSNTSFTTIDNYEDHSFTINGAINKSDINGTNEHPDKNIRCRETENRINSFKNIVSDLDHKYSSCPRSTESIISDKNIVHKWPKKTILVAGDSLVQNLDERRLGKSKYNVKVRSFPGGTINDMYYYLYPLLRKEPEFLILQTASNDCSFSTTDTVLNDLILLKQHIEVAVPGITVIISEPIMRYDDDAMACFRVRNLIKKINTRNFYIMDNSNLVRKHIGKKGLHLNQYGTARLAMNLISLIQGL